MKPRAATNAGARTDNDGIDQTLVDALAALRRAAAALDSALRDAASAGDARAPRSDTDAAA